MSINFKNYNYDKKPVTALVTDTLNGEFLWVGFAKDASTGTCTLRKVSAHNPNQVFYTITLEVDKIVRLKIKDNSIYVAVEHSTIMGYRILTTNPLTSQTVILKPVSIVESPVDIGVGDIYIFYLFPGDISGENSKIVKIGITGTIEETIDLIQNPEIVIKARGITVDAIGDMWVCTYTHPAKLVRIYLNSGGIYVFESKLMV